MVKKEGGFSLTWKDDDWANAFANIALLVFGIISYWVYINSPAGSSLNFLALAYVIMILLVGILWAVDYVWEDNPVVESITLGNRDRFIKSILAGIVLGVVLNFRNLATVSGANFVFVVFVAGWVEEAMFRGHLLPTSQRTFNSLKLPYPDVLAVVGVNVLFALFHYTAYGGNMGAMVAAFVFGVIATIGNSYFKSTGFGIMAHITNNFLVLTRGV